MKADLFIKHSKSIVAQIGSKLRVVIGNQSADLDSIVSAISFAFYLNHQKPGEDVIPIINSSKSILATKKPCMHLFRHLSIDLEDLVYIGDLTRDRLADVFVVDHNELDQRELDELKIDGLVRGVVDHHLDKGGFPHASPRIIDTRVGSNTSTITRLISESNIDLDPSFADMMLYPILFDTNNLTRLTHDTDRNAVEYLKRFASVDPDQLFTELDELKFSVDGSEPVDELLKQDYKLYAGNWAMSSVTLCLAEWIRRGNTLDDIIGFMAENGLFFYALLSIYRDRGEHKRDFVILGDASVVRKYVDLGHDKLVCKGSSTQKGVSHAVFAVGDVSLTRKYWQPQLERFLRDLKLIQ